MKTDAITILDLTQKIIETSKVILVEMQTPKKKPKSEKGDKAGGQGTWAAC
jgi:hypothetical protein